MHFKHKLKFKDWQLGFHYRQMFSALKSILKIVFSDWR